MVNLTINKIPVSVPERTTIMEAAESNGISIPHLCYLKEINEIGACRLCSVEVEGESKLIPSCITEVKEGMNVTTNSARVRSACRMNLGLIMSQHDGHCSMCSRNGNCQLQTLAGDFNMVETPFYEDLPKGRQLDWDKRFPLIKDASKCIKCMRCIQVCNKIQGMGVWDLAGTGGRTRVEVADGVTINQADCTLCCQCLVHCPVGALRVRDDCEKVLNAIEDPEITTVVQIAPAVRAAWGEELGLPMEEATVNRLAGVMRSLGVDYVFDTCFTADLTIMEEGSEFISRLQKGDLAKYPMLTSCCPGWVRFLKLRYPELVGQLSTAKSPQQMFGSVIKSYFAESIGVSPDKICVVSIMPCVSKKSECDLPTMKSAAGVQDVDYVLTTREVIRLMRLENIQIEHVGESPFDKLMGDYTGAGVIFGVTGGVMEAALRSAVYLLTGKNPDVDTFHAVRSSEAGDKPWREASYNVAGTDVRVAVTSGLANADELCKAILRGDVKYDFVEVMACPNGCSGGGGQPVNQKDIDKRKFRGEGLHTLDENMPIRFSHENPDVAKLYADYMGAPLGEKSEELLHTDHFAWEVIPR